MLDILLFLQSKFKEKLTETLKAVFPILGIVLLLLTVIVKIIVWPTQKKSYMSSAKMRVLKPKLDEITKQYPNPDQAMQKQQAMMQVYSQYGVSPMGGCLPMLIQMPIWLALFNFIPNAIDLRGESFLWADDLSAYDDLIRWDAYVTEPWWDHEPSNDRTKHRFPISANSMASNNLLEQNPGY